MATFTKTVDAPKKSTGGTLRGGKSTPYSLCRTKAKSEQLLQNVNEEGDVKKNRIII